MPISYSVDSERGLIVSRWEGPVTAEDLASHWKKLFSDERALALRRSFADLRGSDLLFSGADLHRLTSDIVLPELEHGSWKTAIIVDRPVNFGISRQFQNWARLFSDSELFEDEHAALVWLLAR